MNPKEMASSLSVIAMIKQGLPLTMRGWVNSLGLHVQERNIGQLSRIQAGGQFKSYFDAWEEDGQYKIRRFDPVIWQKRFASLVEPTLDIATFLAHSASTGNELSGEDKTLLDEAVKSFKRTGEWPGLPGAALDNDYEKSSPGNETTSVTEQERPVSSADDERIKAAPQNPEDTNQALPDVETLSADIKNALVELAMATSPIEFGERAQNTHALAKIQADALVEKINDLAEDSPLAGSAVGALSELVFAMGQAEASATGNPFSMVGAPPKVQESWLALVKAGVDDEASALARALAAYRRLHGLEP